LIGKQDSVLLELHAWFRRRERQSPNSNPSMPGGSRARVYAMDDAHLDRKRSRFAKCVRSILIILGNTIILFVIVNIAAAPFGRKAPSVSNEEHRQRAGEAVLEKYGFEFFRRVYPGKTDAQIRQLIFDIPELKTAYEPFAEFRSAAILTTNLNVHQAGFRLLGENQGPWPLDRRALNIFVFGGSTTFGSGVADDKTIPAALQQILRSRHSGSDTGINVYNFGVGAFFSTQEVTFFQNQLRYGNVPDMVVFVDGLNDFYFWDGEPANAQTARNAIYVIDSLSRQLGSDRGPGWHLVQFLKSLPVVKLMQTLAEKSGNDEWSWNGQGETAPSLADAPRPPSAPAPLQASSEDSARDIYASRYADGFEISDPQRIRDVIERYLVNKGIAQGAANQFGIEAVFAWQPVPTYNYDLAYHAQGVRQAHRRTRYGYPAMAEYAATHRLGANFAWCADIQRDARRPLYVDQIHYSEVGNHMVADCIADTIIGSGALERAMTRLRLQIAAGERGPGAGVQVATPAMATQVIAPLFGPRAQVQDLDMSMPLSEWRDLASNGVRLRDASENFAEISERFPLDHDVADRTYQVSVRIKPYSSDYFGLVMSCVGGAHPEHFVMFLNPETMGVISASGYYRIAQEASGWVRVVQAGTCRDGGNDQLQVSLYPRHGRPEGRGDIVFGGGEVVRLVAPIAPTAESGR